MLEIAFKLNEAQTVVLDEGEAAQLGLHLAVFGRDEEMPRSRLLAEKIATAINSPGKDNLPCYSSRRCSATTSVPHSTR